MQIITLNDFSGDGKVHNVGDLFQLPSQTAVTKLIIREISGGAGTTRVGGASSVGPSNGIPLSASDLFLLDFSGRYFSLNDIFIYTGSSDILALAVTL